MSPHEAISYFGKQLSQYERDEILDLKDQIYYINP